MEEKGPETEAAQANPGYALFQLAKALTTHESHVDPEVRERAEKRIARWMAVYSGLLTGKLEIGTRVPVAAAPEWATLEVMTGGFATGGMLAGGPLLDHEETQLSRLPPHLTAKGREGLNAYYLTDTGLAELRERLRTGCYDVCVPEEGALLVVAWLAENGYAAAARALLDEISPFFAKLRFYPVPRESPRQFGSRVHVQNVAATIAAIKRISPNHRILAQKEAIEVWAPLYDRTIQLFLETVQGDAPRVRLCSDGSRECGADGAFTIDGGWPCQVYPDDWSTRAHAILDAYGRLRNSHRLCGRPERSKDSFAQLRQYLRVCATNPRSLSGRDVGRIRLVLGRHIAKRGLPGSTHDMEFRHRQAQQANSPTHYDISRAMLPRLEAFPPDSGLDDLGPVMHSITIEESARSGVPRNTALPRSLQAKIQRCLSDAVDVLVERGIVTSGDTLAQVLPQLTSGLRAAGITDPALRRLYTAVYQAFRRRRSLLLLDLERQVQLEELPWIAAMERFRTKDLSTTELSQQALLEVTTLTVVSFPHAILPNKLLQELRALAKGAGLDLPLVDEVAADIFMGTFSDKFLVAARRAARALKGTLYERYYGISYEEMGRIPNARRTRPSWFRRPATDPFAELCSKRAGVKYGGWDTAVNGMIIEQQQILTTQNLAVLFDGLGLTIALQSRLAELAKRCFAWVCRRQQVKAANKHALLIMLKNTAYAWRQMIFFLALLPDEEIQLFRTWAHGRLKEQPEDFQKRFQPAMAGLDVAADGHELDSHAGRLVGARRFLGWTNEEHWLVS